MRFFTLFRGVWVVWRNGVSRGSGWLLCALPSFFHVFVQVHLNSMNVFRVFLVTSSLCMGVAGFVSTVLLNGNISAPYEVLATRVTETAPQHLAVTARSAEWLDHAVLDLLPEEVRPIPVSADFVDLYTEEVDTGHRRSRETLLLGSDCRVEEVLGFFDCTRVAGSFLSSDSHSPGREKQLFLSTVLAHELHVVRGDLLRLPGGFFARVRDVIDHPVFNGLNGGRFAFGRTEDVAALFGQVGKVRSVYVDGSSAVPVVWPPDLLLQANIGPPAGFSLPTLFLMMRGFLLLGGSIVAFAGTLLGISVFLATVLEQKRTRAVLHISGASQRYLLGVHLFEGALAGLAAGLLAVPCGYALSVVLTERFGNAMLQGTGVHLDALFPLWAMGLCVAGGVFLGIFASGVVVSLLLDQGVSDWYSFGQFRCIGVFNPWWGIVGVCLTMLAVVSAWLAGQGKVPLFFAYLALFVFAIGCLQVIVLMSPSLVQILSRVQARRFQGFHLLIRANLLRFPLRTGVTIGTIAFGVMFLVGIPGIKESVRRSYLEVDSLVQEQELFVVGKNLGEQSDGPLAFELMQKILTDPRVEEVWIEGERLLPGPFVVMGVSQRHPFLERFLEGLSLAEVQSVLRSGNILVNQQAASALHADAGSVVSLPTPLGPRDFRIGGVVDIKANQSAVSNMILADYQEMEKIWDGPVHNLLLRMPSEKTKMSVQNDLEKRWPLSVYDKKSFLNHVVRGHAIFLQPFWDIGVLILFLSAAGVFTALFLSLRSRYHERFAMRCQGFSAGMEFFTVLGESLVLGILGLVCGVLLGLMLMLLMGLVGPVTLMIDPVFGIPWRAILETALIVVLVCLCSALPSVFETSRLSSPASRLHEL